jgi:hypothetical protein
MSNPEENTPDLLPVVNPELRPLVRALSNHAIVLESTKRQVRSLRDRIRVHVGKLPTAELAELGRVFRAESDSAVAIAQATEKLAAG